LPVFEKALEKKRGDANAVALVALEVIQKEQAVPALKVCLTGHDPVTRLAAARALLPHLPRESLQTLVDLLDCGQQPVQAQAVRLLEAITEKPVPARDDRGFRDWQREVKQIDTNRLVKLALANRLRLSGAKAVFFEAFSTPSADVREGYGVLRHAATQATTDVVKDGRLFLSGNQGFGDQKLFLEALRWNRTPALPDEFTVDVKLGGEAQAAGLWHLGVSVGDIRILFHPGHPAGGFRAENVKTKTPCKAFSGNVNMNFTPAPGKLHDMKILARRTKDGAAFDVTIVNADNPKEVFRHSFQSTSDEIGQWNQIGLERSGNSGGAAMFDALLVQTR
jgi:hypothetical protein